MKSLCVVVFLALIIFPSLMCSPVSKRNTAQLSIWNKSTQSFILKLYKNLASGQTSFAQLGTKRIHGVWASVTTIVNAQGSPPNVVYLSVPLNGTSLPLNQTFLVNLHLSVQAVSGVQQGDCNLVIHDIKSSSEIASETLPCASSSNLVLPITSYVKKWLVKPSTNAGIKVCISAKSNSANIPVASLPFVSTSPSVEPPYYIFFV